jgi:hypothetical protein
MHACVVSARHAQVMDRMTAAMAQHQEGLERQAEQQRQRDERIRLQEEQNREYQVSALVGLCACVCAT